jgi:hypothetical protein
MGACLWWQACRLRSGRAAADMAASTEKSISFANALGITRSAFSIDEELARSLQYLFEFPFSDLSE